MKPFTFEDRERLADDVFAAVRRKLIEKGREYAGGEKDTLNNFTRRSLWMNRNRKDVIFNDLSKHLTAIMDWALRDHRLEIEDMRHRGEDAIVYIMLLIAVSLQEHESSDTL